MGFLENTTDFEGKIQILSDFIEQYEGSDDESIRDLLTTFNLSFDYAFGLVYGHIAALTPLGTAHIEALWTALLETLGLEDRYYVDLYALATAADIVEDGMLPDPDTIY